MGLYDPLPKKAFEKRDRQAAGLFLLFKSMGFHSLLPASRSDSEKSFHPVAGAIRGRNLVGESFGATRPTSRSALRRGRRSKS